MINFNFGLVFLPKCVKFGYFTWLSLILILSLISCSSFKNKSSDFENFEVQANRYVPKISILVRFENGQSVQISSPTSLIISSNAHVSIQIAEDTIQTIVLLKGESRVPFKMFENIDTTEFSFEISEIFCADEYDKYTLNLGIRIFTATEGISFTSISLKNGHIRGLCD